MASRCALRRRAVSLNGLLESRTTLRGYVAILRAHTIYLRHEVGELYFELHRGTYTTHSALKRVNRINERLLRNAEMLASFAVVLGLVNVSEYPYNELER